ncbi:MAG: hypothetical protein ACRD4Q_11140, partial [Candidatus Acidiferrales bacterium]
LCLAQSDGCVIQAGGNLHRGFGNKPSSLQRVAENLYLAVILSAGWKMLRSAVCDGRGSGHDFSRADSARNISPASAAAPVRLHQGLKPVPSLRLYGRAEAMC